MRAGLYWMLLSRFLTMGGELAHITGGEVAQAVVWAPAPPTALSSGAQAGSHSTVSQSQCASIQERMRWLLGMLR